MEDILASIKKVIAEEKELRTAAEAAEETAPQDPEEEDEDILELDDPIAPVDLGPPLLDEEAADETRHSLEELSSIAATHPPQPQVNPLEEVIREMLRPILKQWLDDNLPEIVNEHVRREITRITGRPVGPS